MSKILKFKKMGGLLLGTALLLSACSSGANNPGNSATKAPDKVESEKRGSISVSIYDRGSVPPEQGTIDKNSWTKWVNDNGPADVKFIPVPRWESREKFNVMFASGNAPDVIFEYDTSYRNELISQKQLMPLNELIEEHSVEYKELLNKYPIMRKVTTRPDGNIYEFARLNGQGINHLYIIRTDWLEKVGMEAPKTTDDLYQVAEAFVKQDPDGNNKADTLSMNVTFVGDQMLSNMFQAVNYKVQDDQLVPTWENKIAKNNFVKKLYDNGMIDKDFLTDKNGEKSKQDFINGKLGIYGSNGGEAYATLKALRANDPNAKFAVIGLPASEFGQFGPVVNNPIQAIAAVNANTKDPVAVIKYMDFLNKRSTMMTLNFGMEGEHYNLDGEGVPILVDLEKSKKEVDFMGDLRMSNSAAVLGDISHLRYKMNLNDPFDAEYLELYTAAEKLYLNPDAPMADFTHGEHAPSLPKDLQLIVTNTSEQMTSYSQQALIGGNKYTVEQAIADSKSFWEKAGGLKVDEWYADWYANNKENAILTKDIYSVKID
jgi:putative aldouronate transport system substrate-binding protein